MIDSNNLAFSDKDKADTLASAFLKCHKVSINVISPHEVEAEDTYNLIKYRSVTIPVDELWDEFDIDIIIHKLKIKKASGYDNISNQILKKLTLSALVLLKDIFNACLNICYFPVKWKTGKVIAIPKPGKIHTDPMNYRPITLLPTMGKVFEKAILAKLILFEETNSIIIPQQFGFRSKHSTTQQIIRITENISMNFNKNQSTGMALLDIEKAYDSVWHKGLLFKMRKYNYPLSLIKLTSSFLSDRSSFVDINGIGSKLYSIPAGVPQGSLLSPHLFNIYINGIPKPKNCDLAIYADDTALFTNVDSQDIEQLISNLEQGLKKIKKYFSDWKIRINESKTEAIIFTHSTIMQKKMKNRQLSYNNVNLEWKDNVKYLGIHLDKKLTMSYNITNSIKKQTNEYQSYTHYFTKNHM